MSNVYFVSKKKKKKFQSEKKQLSDYNLKALEYFKYFYIQPSSNYEKKTHTHTQCFVFRLLLRRKILFYEIVSTCFQIETLPNILRRTSYCSEFWLMGNVIKFVNENIANIYENLWRELSYRNMRDLFVRKIGKKINNNNNKIRN